MSDSTKLTFIDLPGPGVDATEHPLLRALKSDDTKVPRQNQHRGGRTVSSAMPGDPQPTPSVTIIHRTPLHDIAIYMRASGKSNKFIAEQCGFTPNYVSILTRQPWFLKAVREIIAESGQAAVDQLLRQEQENSVLTLLELRDSAKSETVRKDAAIHLLDRFRGKCPQHIVHEDAPPIDDPVNEARRIQERVTELSRTLLGDASSEQDFTPDSGCE